MIIALPLERRGKNWNRLLDTHTLNTLNVIKRYLICSWRKIPIYEIALLHVNTHLAEHQLARNIMWMRAACNCIFFCCVTFMFLSSGAVCCSPYCGVLGWTSWKPCTPAGEQTRDVLLCCPTNLQVQTLEECLRVCNLTKEITVSMQNCTYTPIHVNVTTTTMVPERSSVVSSVSDVNSLEMLSSTTSTTSLNVEFSSDISSPTIYSPSLSSEGTDKEWTEDTSSTLEGTSVSMMTSSETPTLRWGIKGFNIKYNLWILKIRMNILFNYIYFFFKNERAIIIW